MTDAIHMTDFIPIELDSCEISRNLKDCLVDWAEIYKTDALIANGLY